MVVPWFRISSVVGLGRVSCQSTMQVPENEYSGCARRV